MVYLLLGYRRWIDATEQSRNNFPSSLFYEYRIQQVNNDKIKLPLNALGISQTRVECRLIEGRKKCVQMY